MATARVVIDDLVAFLRARLDEDETNAGKALAQWADTHFTIAPGSLVIVEFHRRHNPRRVLCEVEAKRAILHQWEASPPNSPGLTFVLYNLAAVYSDHPDYQKEWDVN